MFVLFFLLSSFSIVQMENGEEQRMVMSMSERMIFILRRQLALARITNIAVALCFLRSSMINTLH
jgi:hypothetical protein